MIYLREKRSGNFEISNKENSTVQFKTQKSFKAWYDLNGQSYFGKGKIIKATYSRSQAYFANAQEVIDFIKK